MKAIEININNKTYHLSPQGVNYDLSEIGKDKNGKEKTTNLGYSMNISRCLDLISKDNIGSQDEIMSLKDYVDALSDRYTELKDMVELQF